MRNPRLPIFKAVLYFMEIWKDLTGYEDLYQISSYGRFKIKDRVRAEGVRGQKFVKERITIGAKAGKKGSDYYVVSITKKGFKRTYKKLHRLVAIEFIPNPENKPQVNHIDQDRFNNHVLNLEWTTAMENSCHGRINKNYKSKYHGVTFNIVSKKWTSKVKINKKMHSLGSFSTEIEAHIARVNFLKSKGIVNKYETVHVLPINQPYSK